MTHKKQLPFPKNRHGHYVLTITGLDLTGEQEIARVNGDLDDYERRLLMNTGASSYDNNHRLEDGKEYNIVLVLNNEITTSIQRPVHSSNFPVKTEDVQKYARGFGYKVPLAGVMPRISEMVSDEQMKKMEIFYFVCFHDPIEDCLGNMNNLMMRLFFKRLLSYRNINPNDPWDDYGAFVFFDPAN